MDHIKQDIQITNCTHATKDRKKNVLQYFSSSTVSYNLSIKHSTNYITHAYTRKVKYLINVSFPLDICLTTQDGKDS